jgi:hypothetical protein
MPEMSHVDELLSPIGGASVPAAQEEIDGSTFGRRDR